MDDVNGSALATSPQNPDSFLGQIIKRRYRVIRELSAGPIGTLYLAEDLSTWNKVAVKVLRREFAEDAQFVTAFHQQAPRLAALCKGHDAIVKIFEFDQADEGTLFIAMEYVDGRSLSDLIQQEGLLHVKRALRFAIQIGEALEAAHNAGFAHGALTSHSVIVVGPDMAKLTDFEISGLRRTAAMKRLGCSGPIDMEYMTPEQIEGAEITEQTDIYAFGIVLYQMLCGAVPFSAPEPDVVRAKHLYKVAVPPRKLHRKVPSSVERILMQTLEKRPGRRPDITAVVHELWTAERRLEEGLTSRIRVATQALAGAVKDAATKSMRVKTKWKLIGSCALLILMAVPTAWMVFSHRRSESGYTPEVQQKSGRGAAEGPPMPALPPREEKGQGNVGESRDQPASPQQSTSRKDVIPIGSSEKQPNVSRPARAATPVESKPGEESDSSDPSDPTVVIDWLLKEYSAKRQ